MSKRKAAVAVLLAVAIALTVAGCGKQAADSLEVLAVTGGGEVRGVAGTDVNRAAIDGLEEEYAGLYEVADITPPGLWENQQMQLISIGGPPFEESLNTYALVLLDDGAAQYIMGGAENMGMGLLTDSVYCADLNEDGVYEICMNSAVGSGIIHNFVQVYDPAAGSHYSLSARMDQDYRFALDQNGVLYIAAREWDGGEAQAYRFTLGKGGIILGEAG